MWVQIYVIFINYASISKKKLIFNDKKTIIYHFPLISSNGFITNSRSFINGWGMVRWGVFR